jgi:uncharacterized membrane protein YphA (DoxX/SURF4 family)
MVGVSKRALIVIILRLVLAWVFIQAGLPKIQDPLAFATAIDGYRIVSGPATLWVATILPWMEVVIGIGLLIPWIRRASGITMGLLLSVFIALHISAWARGLDISCGCFGSEESSSSEYDLLILRNLALLIMVLFTSRNYTLKQGPSRNKNHTK